MYQVVKQYGESNDYYTIFDSQMNQYCDDDGNPLRYETYSEAKQICELLNEEN